LDLVSSSKTKNDKDATGPFQLQLQFARGSSFLRARLFGGRAPVHTKASSSSSRPKRTILQTLTGSFFFHLPYRSLSTVRLTPHVDLSSTYAEFSCVAEAMAGGAGRTKAVLNLEYENPTLAVVHELNDFHSVSPEISIYNARITYQWDWILSKSQKSRIRTKVDPLEAIHVTWTDESAQDGGTWVTHVRLPLDGTTGVSALAADVRIQRQFRF